MNTRRITGAVVSAVLTAVLATGSPRPAEAGTLYGVAIQQATGSSMDPFPPGRHLVVLDPATGQVTQIVGELGAEIEGLAFQPGTEQLFGAGEPLGGSGTGNLYKVSTGTGAASLVGSHGFGPGSGSGPGQDGSYFFSDLAFHSDGSLYGMDFYRNRPIEINPATGQALTDGNGPFLADEIGLAANAQNAFFAGPTDPSSPLTDLLKVDPDSGVATDATDLTGYGAYFGLSEGTGPGEVYLSGFEALTFDENGSLFGMALFGSSDLLYLGGSYLGEINTTTGQMTVIGRTNYGGDTVYVDAIAFVPEPLSLGLLAGGLGVWLLRSRTRRRD